MHTYEETFRKFATQYEAEEFAIKCGVKGAYVSMRGAASSAKPWHVVRTVWVDS